MLNIAIIGGGLSGLALARELLATDCSFVVFEARERFGGRILSFHAESAVGKEPNSACFDLGPSWIWPEFQPRMLRFLQENDIAIFPQWTKGRSLYHADRESPPQAYREESPYESARRIVGGASRLIEALINALPNEQLSLNHQLVSVQDHRAYVELHFKVNDEDVVVAARKVVTTIPPRLLLNTVDFTPEIDDRLRKVMHDTPTWMAGYAKAVIRYERAFWREADIAGNALVVYPGAVLAEIFDACSPDGKSAALGGFFALPAGLRRRYRNDFEILIIEQLTRLFGREAVQPLDITIKDWADDALTAVTEDEQPPTTHPQYGHAWFQQDHWNGKLYFSGTETAPEFGGYLEGALESAERVRKSLMP